MFISKNHKSIRLFISYSQSDKRYFEVIKSHLHLIISDRSVCRDVIARAIEEPLTSFNNRIHFEGLQEDDIILVVLSMRWISSINRNSLEVQICDLNERLRQQSIQAKIPVIPIHLQKVDEEFFNISPIGKYSCFPSKERPLLSLTNRESAFAEIPKKVREAISRVHETWEKKREFYRNEEKIEQNKRQLEREVANEIEREYPDITEKTLSNLQELARKLNIGDGILQQILDNAYLNKRSRYENAKIQYEYFLANKLKKAVSLEDLDRSSLDEFANQAGLNELDVKQIERNVLEAYPLVTSIQTNSTPVKTEQRGKNTFFENPLYGLLTGGLIGSLLSLISLIPLPYSGGSIVPLLTPPPEPRSPSPPPKKDPRSVPPPSSETCSPPQAKPELPGTYTVNQPGFLNVSQGINLSCAVLFRVKNGSSVVGVGKVATGADGEKWAKISFKGQEGWVPKRFLSKHVRGKW